MNTADDKYIYETTTRELLTTNGLVKTVNKDLQITFECINS